MMTVCDSLLDCEQINVVNKNNFILIEFPYLENICCPYYTSWGSAQSHFCTYLSEHMKILLAITITITKYLCMAF